MIFYEDISLKSTILYKYLIILYIRHGYNSLYNNVNIDADCTLNLKWSVRLYQQNRSKEAVHVSGVIIFYSISLNRSSLIS